MRQKPFLGASWRGLAEKTSKTQCTCNPLLVSILTTEQKNSFDFSQPLHDSQHNFETGATARFSLQRVCLLSYRKGDMPTIFLVSLYLKETNTLVKTCVLLRNWESKHATGTEAKGLFEVAEIISHRPFSARNPEKVRKYEIHA